MEIRLENLHLDNEASRVKVSLYLSNLLKKKKNMLGGGAGREVGGS